MYGHCVILRGEKYVLSSALCFFFFFTFRGQEVLRDEKCDILDCFKLRERLGWNELLEDCDFGSVGNA